MEHRHGGTILNLTHVGHSTYAKVADWFFVGNVKWNDGSVSEAAEIAPFHLCGEPEEVNPYFAKLNDYLVEVGTYLDKPKHMRDGRIVHWQPKEPTGRKAL